VTGVQTCALPIYFAAAFLEDATLKGSVDTLESPSAKIVLGQVVEMGTGAFGVRFDMKRAAELRQAMVRDRKTF
jgi:DNA-directed RNA polymerase I subunit RPA1